MWRRKLHRKAAVTVLLISAIMLCSGCSRNREGITIKGTTFYFTTGLEETAVMKSGDFALTEGQVRLLMTSVKRGYEDILTAGIWNVDINGKQFGDYVEESVLDMCARLLLVNMLADDKGIELNEAEVEECAGSAVKFYEEYRTELEYISPEETEKLFVMMRLSDKTYDELTRNVNTEVSVDEARIIKIQYIYSKDSRKKLENALAELEEGADFMTIAGRYSDSADYSVELGRGEMITEFEEAAFNLDEGQMSGIVSCDNGFYLIYCVNDNVEDKAESQKEKIIQKRREEQFAKFFNDYAKDVKLYFDERLWEQSIAWE